MHLLISHAIQTVEIFEQFVTFKTGQKNSFFRLTSFSFSLVSGFILIISLKLFQNPNCYILIDSIIFHSLVYFSFCSFLLFRYSTLSVSQFHNLYIILKFFNLCSFSFSIPLAFVRSTF
jgi:hypothetical protein